MLHVGVDGSAQLRHVAAAIKAAGDKTMGREMSAGLRRAVKPLQEAIRDSADETLPKAGGYAAEFTRSMRFRTATRAGGRTAAVRLTTFSDGTKERRDIRRLEAGQLRHPVYGRSRPLRNRQRVPNPWAVTTIEAGFFQRGTDKAAAVVEKEMLTVLDGLAARIAKG
jgi:hypothetical protein